MEYKGHFIWALVASSTGKLYVVMIHILSQRFSTRDGWNLERIDQVTTMAIIFLIFLMKAGQVYSNTNLAILKGNFHLVSKAWGCVLASLHFLLRQILLMMNYFLRM